VSSTFLVLEQDQKIVTNSYQQLITQLAQAIADDRPLPAITDTLDSGTGAGSGTVSLFPIKPHGQSHGDTYFPIDTGGYHQPISGTPSIFNMVSVARYSEMD
jgi:hypothetical protein